MNRQRHCNYCGQPLPEIRLGVRLPPLKARIFDLIQRSGDDGITNADLRDILGLGLKCVESHVYQINELIGDSGYRIRARGWGYRLIKDHRRATVTHE
jgi:hypothetical protein